MRCKVKSSLLIFMKVNPSFIEFNFEYVHKITSLCGNLSHNMFISCYFKVHLILKRLNFIYMYRMLVLSHQGEFVSTRNTSITETDEQLRFNYYTVHNEKQNKKSYRYFSNPCLWYRANIKVKSVTLHFKFFLSQFVLDLLKT